MMRTGHALPVTLAAPSVNGKTELRVTPGVVDDQARELFLFAQCHVLALALHERTGWPLWVAEQQLHNGEWTWVHVGVQTPAGRWLDIDGSRDAQAVAGWLARWGLPVRLRVLDTLAAWYTLCGLPPETPVTWWRTNATDNDGAALTESFVSVLLAAEEAA